MSNKATPADVALWAPILEAYTALSPRKIPGARWVVEIVDEESDDDEGTIRIGTIRHADVSLDTIHGLIAVAIGEGLVTPELLNPEAAEPPADDSEAEADEAPVRVVVAAKYKVEYAARGNANHCGDWLALMLDGMFETVIVDGDKAGSLFNHEQYAAFLKLNGVEMVGKWADLPSSGQKGWQGRFRMNGRQKLEKAILTSGVLRLLDGREVAVDTDWALAMQAKRPSLKLEWLASKAT